MNEQSAKLSNRWPAIRTQTAGIRAAIESKPAMARLSKRTEIQRKLVADYKRELAREGRGSDHR